MKYVGNILMNAILAVAFMSMLFVSCSDNDDIPDLPMPRNPEESTKDEDFRKWLLSPS